MTTVAFVVAGYVLGSMPWGYWLVRLVKHEDIRTQGSGNIGATNAGANPFAVSSTTTGSPSRQPYARHTFVPPMLPLPYCLMSSCLTSRTSQ